MPPDERIIHRVTQGNRMLTLELLDESAGELRGFLVDDTAPFARRRGGRGTHVIYHVHKPSVSRREKWTDIVDAMPTWVMVPVYGMVPIWTQRADPSGAAPWSAKKKPTVDTDAVRPGRRGISFGKV